MIQTTIATLAMTINSRRRQSPRARVGHDEPSAPVHRKIGQADREIQHLLHPPIAAFAEDLRRRPVRGVPDSGCFVTVRVSFTHLV